jgi:hypothetical protein
MEDKNVALFLKMRTGFHHFCLIQLNDREKRKKKRIYEALAESYIVHAVWWLHYRFILIMLVRVYIVHDPSISRMRQLPTKLQPKIFRSIKLSTLRREE